MNYLALGDSYTIGELVDFSDNFPSQLVRILNEKRIECKLGELVATTGWTTDELDNAIQEKKLSRNFDFVTLLIGVNNQYRGRDVIEYEAQFSSLLQQAIECAKGNSARVIVLSIPDWGLTPFNKDRDQTTTSNEIDAFNVVNRNKASVMGCHYIDITESTRVHSKDPHFLSSDLLHYSKYEYEIWAHKIARVVIDF